jgi:hypothetical protein
MITKKKLKEEIDKLPYNLLDQVHEFINSIKIRKKMYKKIRSFKLRGQYDHVNIREKAYE